jgi:hypothetical protein
LAGFRKRFAGVVVDGIILGIVGRVVVGIFRQQVRGSLDALATIDSPLRPLITPKGALGS